MAREIKFRAWDKVNKRMGYFHPGFTWNDEYDLWHLSEAENGFRMAEVPCGDNIELMQFTDLTDKNGKEICEGDVVQFLGYGEDTDYEERTPQSRHIVTLENFRFWLKDESLDVELEELIDPADCEVIGNIYENPELLKEAQTDDR